MTDYNAIYDAAPVPQTGDFPERITFQSPGQVVEGTLTDIRLTSKEGYEPCIVHDIALDDGTRVSVFCSTTSQRRLVNAKRPVPGQRVRWEFKGYEGQAKVFELLVAGGDTPAAAPAPAPAPPATAAPPQAPQVPPAWGAQPNPAPAPQPPAGPPAWA